MTTSLLVLASTIAAVRWLPGDRPPDQRKSADERIGFGRLLRDPRVLGLCVVGGGAMCAFSSVFTYFPFYLAAPPLALSTGVITSLYLAYVVGIVMGPIAGRIGNRLGNGRTMMLAALVFAAALMLTLIPRLPVLVLALVGVCAGFFTTHAAAVGGLNRALTAARGRANALYMLFYYLGGALGINASGAFYGAWRWPGVALFNAAVLLVPLAMGWREARRFAASSPTSEP